MDIGYRPSRDLIPPDLRLVSEATAALRLREFDLFRAAWQSWFGQAPDDKTVEQVFVAYLFHQRVPHWVRLFARRVLADRAAGSLDPERFGVTHYPRQKPLASPGEGYVTGLYVAAVVVCVILLA
jgi:hypothetical protein